MKTKDIAKQYGGISLIDFEYFLRNSKKYRDYFKDGFTSGVLEDSVCDDAILDYYRYVEVRNEKKAQQAREKEEIAAREKQAKDEKRAAMANMLITSGFNFDGYTIVKYSGYISGDDAVSVDRGMDIFGTGGKVKDKLMESLVIIRRNALRELKEAAYDLGCNAVIGVDFDYLTLDPQTANLAGGTTYQPYVFGVTANGNAVVIVKNEELERRDIYNKQEICETCGTTLNDGWAFCTKCGTPRR